MRPVGARTQSGVFKIEHAANPHQRDAGKEEHQTDREKQITDAHRATIRTVARILNMEDSENDYRQDEQKSQHQMRQEHVHVKIVLERLARSAFEPAEECNAGEVNRIGPKQRDQPENRVE